MTLVVAVPPSTMLADLDESLRTLLRGELGRHGYDRVDIAFEAPTREWAGALSSPAVNVFLYDLRESADHKRRTIDERMRKGAAYASRPPLILDCSYAVTAWTKSVEDEHRLLSQVLSILYSYPRLPDDVLEGRLLDGSQQFPLTARVGQARGEGKADFWTAVGGQYKASLDYVVKLTCGPGDALERGPEVRSQVIRVADGLPGGAGLVELHRIGGRVVDGDGEPVSDAWVGLPEVGRFVTTGADGRFRFDRVPAGTHACLARTAEGEELEADVTVPGPQIADLVAGTGARTAKRAKR